MLFMKLSSTSKNYFIIIYRILTFSFNEETIKRLVNEIFSNMSYLPFDNIAQDCTPLHNCPLLRLSLQLTV